MKANASEPQMTCRNSEDDIETRLAQRTWDEPGGNLPTARAVSGIYAAPARVRLLWGTGEPVASRDVGSWSAGDLRPTLPGIPPSAGKRKEQDPRARHRGGPPGSSDEGSVTGSERSGRAIQAQMSVNHEAVGGADG